MGVQECRLRTQLLRDPADVVGYVAKHVLRGGPGCRVNEHHLEGQRLAPDARDALQVFIHELDLEGAVPPILGAELEAEHEHVTGAARG